MENKVKKFKRKDITDLIEKAKMNDRIITVRPFIHVQVAKFKRINQFKTAI